MLNPVVEVVRGIVAHYRRQAAVDGLERLSDHALRDIGLRRDQLDALRVAEKPAWVPKPGPAARAVRRPSLQGCS